MQEISLNGIVTMNAGDYFELPLYAYTKAEDNSGMLVPLKYSDIFDKKVDTELWFSIVEPFQPFEHGVVRKKVNKDTVYRTKRKEINKDGQEIYIDNEDLFIILNSSDTMDLLPGTYYYEVKLVEKTTSENNHLCADGFKINTIIPRRKFFIL